MFRYFLLPSILLFITHLTFAQNPANLNATAYKTTVHLIWDDFAAEEPLGYYLYRSTSSGNYGEPARVIGNYNDYTDYNLTNNTNYYYKIAAFDESGNETAVSEEIMVSTNNNDYLKVASLDLLIPIYNGGMSATAPDEIMQGLEFAREIFFRNTYGKLNLKYHFLIIDGYPPLRADGLADFNTIGADLTDRGIQDNEYDAIHICALKLYGWFGGAQWLGQTAGSMAYNWTGFDSENHFTRGDAWVFTHEFGHSLDLIIARLSGYPEMVFNHYAHAHPMIPEIGVFDSGEDFDGMALVLRLFEHHLDYQAPWDGYLEVMDNDNDGLADNDSRLVNDEMRFGSSPMAADTEGDGLVDLAEFTSDIYQGSNPNIADTDGDGETDGMDIYPSANFLRENYKADQAINVDGVLSAAEAWQSMGSGTWYSKLPGAVLNSYTTWDDNYLYFAFESNEHLKYHLLIDGNGEDGIFASEQRWTQGDYTSFDATSYGTSYFDKASLLIRADDAQVYKREVPLGGSMVETVFQNGIYTTEVKLPHNLGPGFGFNYQDPSSPVLSELSFSKGDTLGIQLLAHPLAQSNAYEWSDWRTRNWISLHQPFHYYDMILSDDNIGEYCSSHGDFPWHEWITRVEFADLDNTSGKSQYFDFTNLTANVFTDQNYNITLTTGFSYFTFDEYWRVWIDFNQDGDFEDAGETVLSQIMNAPPDGTPTAFINGQINIPPSALQGNTRMRVSMQRGAYPTPCAILPFGEVEDYSVSIQTLQQLPNLRLPNTELIPGGNILCYTNPGEPFLFFGGIILNSGIVDAGPFNVKVYISEDQNVSADDVFWKEIPYSGLEANNVESFSVYDPIPASIDPGDYFVLLEVDPENQVIESNENDNLFIGPSQLGAPDFAFNSIPTLPTRVFPGNQIEFQSELINLSPFPLLEDPDGLTVKTFLSVDNTYDAGSDIEIGSSTIAFDQFSNPPFFENGLATVPLIANIPIGTQEGDYYFILLIDNFCEQIGINNASDAFPVEVTAGQPGVYCGSFGDFPWHEWIAGVQLANINNPSGKSPYFDYTHISTNLNQGQNYPIALTTGISYFTFDEYWRVWIDFNQDNDFTDAGEMVLSSILPAPPDGTPTAILNDNISIPATAMTGSTRMRVSMKRGAYPTPCEVFPFGEVEDYTVNIVPSSGCTISFGTGNVQCQDNGSPNDPNDDTFTFEVLVVGAGVSQHWQMTWPGGATSGVFTVPQTVGPLNIADFPGGFNFTLSDNVDPSCSTSGSLTPPDPCSFPPAECGFTTNYSSATSYSGVWAEQTISGYRVIGSQSTSPVGISFAEITTNEDGMEASSDLENLSRPTNSKVIKLRDGNFVIFYINSNNEIQLEKQNSAQTVLWSNSYAIPDAEQIFPGNIIESPTGDLVLVGGVDETTNAGVFPKFFALKTNAEGVQQWLKVDPDVSPSQGVLSALVFEQTQSGGFVVYFRTPDEIKFIGRLSTAGDLQWKTQITSTPLNTVYDASETTDGSILASYVSTTISGPSFDHVNFVKMDPSGNIEWTRSEADIFGSPPNPLFIDYRTPYAAAAPNGGFAVAFIGQSGLYLAGLDANGNTVWDKTHDLQVVPTFLTQSTDSGYLLTGSEANNLWLMKTDAQGEICEEPPGEYCMSYGEFPWEDWITEVEIADLNNPSGKSKYFDYTHISANVQMGQSYPVALTTGFSYTAWDEYWRIWIDFNQDGDFEDANEMVFSEFIPAPPHGTATSTLDGQITIPSGIATGSTRMRVTKKRNAYATPCEILDFGEVEDYSVNIPSVGPNSTAFERLSNLNFTANLEKNRINLNGAYYSNESISSILIEKSSNGQSFELMDEYIVHSQPAEVKTIQLKDHDPIDGNNYYRSSMRLANGAIIYSPVEMVNYEKALDFTVFPNPAFNEINVLLTDPPKVDMQWQITDNYGRVIWRKIVTKNEFFPYRILITDLEPGIYNLFVIQQGKKAESRKFVVINK